MGEIRNWDEVQETRNGDFFGLKNFLNDETVQGKELQEILIKIHSYWIRELDIDGFRLDAVKHMEERAVARFCSRIREYAYSLGKKNFFLFGELVAGDEACNNYIGPNTSIQIADKTIYYGLNSVLDFPLYHVLADVIKGISSPDKLIHRYEVLRQNAIIRGDLGQFLVTFIDNHDQVGENYKKRFGYQATEEQIIAGVGFLLSALGTPCIYYGTEQGFEGHGEDDGCIREKMFSLENQSVNLLNKQCRIYQEISTIAAIRKSLPELKFGRMYIRETAVKEYNFELAHCKECLLSFSRVLAQEETLIVFNTSMTEEKEARVKLESRVQRKREKMVYLYGGEGSVPVETTFTDDKEVCYVLLHLKPMQFSILK